MFDSSVTLLCCHLDSKNTRALKFVCSDLKLVPFKPNVPVDQVLGYYKKDWIQCFLEWVSIRCTSIYFYWHYSRSKKANPIHLQVDISPNSLLPNICDESKMLSKIPQFHHGSIQCLTTTAKLLPGLWKPTNGGIWPQYTSHWHLSACGARVQYTRQPSMRSNYARYLTTPCCSFRLFH